MHNQSGHDRTARDAIDRNRPQESLAKIGQWPWPRTTVRDLLAELASKGAAVFAFGVLFAEPDRTALTKDYRQIVDRPSIRTRTAAFRKTAPPGLDRDFCRRDEIGFCDCGRRAIKSTVQEL